MTHWQGAQAQAALHVELTVPQLIVTWPSIPSEGQSAWSDVGGYGFDALLLQGSHAQRLIGLCFGQDVLEEICIAIRATRYRGPALVEQRVWSRTMEKGFATGDLTEVDVLTVSASGVEILGYSHSYGERSGEYSEVLSAEQFRASPLQPAFAECRARVETYLTLGF